LAQHEQLFKTTVNTDNQSFTKIPRGQSRHGKILIPALGNLVFKRFRENLLPTEFFFDRMVHFAKVRPLFPKNQSGVPRPVLLIRIGRGVFVESKEE